MNGKAAQIHYSKEQLCFAFLQLLQTNAYKDIPVSEILELSGISRRTFYRHFSNKKDILDYYLDQILEEYLQEKDKILQAETFEQMLAVSLDFWYQKREFLHILIRNQQCDLLLNKLNQNAQLIYLTINAPWHLTGKMDAKNLDYVLEFIVGGYYNILKNWLEQTEPESPQQIAMDIKELFTHINEIFQLGDRLK